ncbi:hypothetical protein [Nocardia otitidiscaviarum]|nr:hypothetical protein [Nocardia otitidiscaviarum]
MADLDRGQLVELGLLRSPLTPEQIVDKALAYRPIELDGPE